MSTGVAGELLVRVTADTRRLASDVERGAEAAGQRGGAAMGKKIAASLGAAFAAAGVAKFLGDSITAASDLGETANKIDAVFGKAAGSVNTFASGSAVALGQSKQAALDAAATMGVFGKASGLAGDDLAAFSTDLVGLSSDLASFYNEDPSAVVEALGSALRGEAEPMRRFGVLLDAASIEAKGLELGLTKTIETASGTKTVFDKSKTAIAANALIMEQTKDAQGDFAKTSDGLANKQRILAAEFENGKAALGQAFLPAALAVVEALRPLANTVLPAVGTALQAAAPFMVSLVDGMVALVGVVVDVVSWLWEFRVPLAIVGVGLAAAAIYTNLFAISLGIALGMQKIVSFVQNFAKGVALLNAALLANPIALVIVGIAALIAIVVVAYQKSETFRRIVQAAWEGIKSAVLAVVDWFRYTAWPVLQAVWDGIRKGLEVLWAVVRVIIALWLSVWTIAFKAMWAVVKWVWERIEPFVRPVLDLVMQGVRNFVNNVLRVWGWLSRLVSAIAGWFSGIWDTVTRWWGKISGWLRDKVSGLVDWFRGVKDSMVSAGKDIVRGLWSGISGMWGWLKDKVLGFIKSALPGPVAKALGISSPSKVFAGIGENVVLGLRAGIEGERPGLVRQVEGLVPSPQARWGVAGAVAQAGGMVGPQVQVYIGNEQLDSHIVRVTDGRGQVIAGRLLSGAVV